MAPTARKGMWKMYEPYFGMKHTPFARNLPPESLYEPPFLGDILGRLGYVADRQLFAVMTADPGCGKSTVLRSFASSLPPDQYEVLYLSDSKMTPRWLYKGLLEQMGMDAKYYRGDARQQLYKEIEILRVVKKRQVVAILDEAHLLGREALEEFRFLLNFSFDSISPMALVLSGQTELLDKLRLRRYDALRQRIDIFCSIPHLDRAETGEYIQSHLNYAGCLRELFTDHAIDEIYKGSTGVPRMVNRICEKALMYASQQQKKLIDDHMVRFVVGHEMQYEGKAVADHV